MADVQAPAIDVIGVVGASMNAGKTTAVASLVHGLARAGHRVAAIKATGTGAFGDYNAYVDAGAHFVADFVDAGMASTYLEPADKIVRSTSGLVAQAAAVGCQLAVVELADGVYQRETAALLADPAFRAAFRGFLYAAPDALSVAGGARVLGDLGIVPAAVTGLISRSPLATAEASAATGLDIITRDALMDPAHATALVQRIRAAAGCPSLELAA